MCRVRALPALCAVAVMASVVALGATPESQPHPVTVQLARVAPKTVHLPVVEGKGLSFRRISTADGLSQTRVAQIVQDDRGFIWFGTQYGLNRYDGYEFKQFVHDARQPASLASAWIFALFKDRDGNLWIGCNQVLDRFNPRTESFTHYRIQAPDSQKPPATIIHISQDQQGFLWLASGTGLHRLDPKTGAVAHYRHAPENPASLSSNDVRWSGEDRRGNLWVGTSEGLDRFDRTTSAVTLRIPLRDAVQVGFLEDRAGRFWVTHASGNGLALFDEASNVLTHYSFYPDEPSAGSLTGVMGMLQDRSGRIWVGSPGAGLLEFDPDGGRFVHYRHRPQDFHSIAEDKVIALFEDREGNVWAGQHSVGPSYFSSRRSGFEIFRHDPENPDSLSVDFVNAIYEEPGGALWIGNDNGLNRIDRASGRRTLTTTGLGEKPMVIAITQSKEGFIWFGTFGHGLVRFDPRTEKYQSFRHDPRKPNSLSSNEVHRLFVDRGGALWAGTEDGLNRFDPQTQTFRVYKLDADNHSSQVIIGIDEDLSGALWLGTGFTGLHRLDPRSGHITVYRSDPHRADGLRDNTVPVVHVSTTGIIWVGTQDGLNSLDPKTGRFTAYDVHDGLPANTVSCILEDDHGSLWLSTTRGLSRFDPVSRTFSNYSVIDGLPGNDLSGWSTCFKSARGELFFAGFAGAVAFYPDALNEDTSSPPVVLTDFQVSGASVLIGPHQPLQRSILYSDRITLSHEQSNFSVSFAGLRFAGPETIRYRYRLEGLEPNWNDSRGNVRRAAYTTLPAGDYTLKVQSATGRGSWGEPGAMLQIRVFPPWWATWWFRTMYYTLIALFVWCVYRVRLRHVSNQLTLQMQARSNERLRIAQDLHDTLLQGLLSASMQLSIADEQMESAAPAKTLVTRVSQLLTQLINEGRNTVRGLRVRSTASDDLERALSCVPRDIGLETEAEFRLTVEGRRQPMVAVIRDELYWIVREGIANAFRHSRATLVEAVLEYSRDNLRVTIRDNGCGMNANIARSGRENHWGLSGMSERAERIGATLEISSAPSAGTEIELILSARLAFEQSAVTRRTR
jgi:ligand-binding sensor domain-containing protein/signal transduction histidine kinase